MEDVRDGDLRVPLISSLLFILVLAGGIFLTLYVLAPDISQPWFPVVALILIGSPWAFWLFTYLYTCTKGCYAGRRLSCVEDHQVSRQGDHLMTRCSSSRDTSTQNHAMGRTLSKDYGSSKATATSNNVGVRHVHFGEVVVVESDGSQVSHGIKSWTNSTKSADMPLNASTSS